MVAAPVNTFVLAAPAVSPQLFGLFIHVVAAVVEGVKPSLYVTVPPCFAVELIAFDTL